jgi:phosphatidylserine/phosphatidylglycerophosphate/cardiolipin synthase-like enzyme
MMDKLLAMSSSDLSAIANAIRNGRLTAPFRPVGLQRILAVDSTAQVADELQSMIGRGFTAQHVAELLDAIVNDRLRRPALDDSISLVTTGPEAAGVTNRDTSVVVRDLFAHAESDVLVAGYAVYQGQKVFQALAERMNEVPALKVRMFLDIQRPQTDTSAVLEIVRRFAKRFVDQQWPAGSRRPEVFYDPRSLATDARERASLHAKCIVVDGMSVFVSSANFTAAAQHRNIELGLLTRSKALAEQITHHFGSLVNDGHLEQLSF